MLDDENDVEPVPLAPETGNRCRITVVLDQPGRPVQILDPNGVRKLLRVWRGLGALGVGRSAAGVPRGGSVGTPTYIPQHTLIILKIHKWGKKLFQKKFAH